MNEREALEPKPPNESGSTSCIVRWMRWMVETPSGWLGAWDKEAFAAYARSVLATQQAPTGVPQQAQEPLGEIVTFGYGDGQKEVSWRQGRMPAVGTKLYAHPPSEVVKALPPGMVLLPRNPRRLSSEQVQVLLKLENGHVAIFDAWEQIVRLEDAEPTPALSAEPPAQPEQFPMTSSEAWLFKAQRPGRHSVWASVSPDEWHGHDDTAALSPKWAWVDRYPLAICGKPERIFPKPEQGSSGPARDDTSLTAAPASERKD